MTHDQYTQMFKTEIVQAIRDGEEWVDAMIKRMEIEPDVSYRHLCSAREYLEIGTMMLRKALVHRD